MRHRRDSETGLKRLLLASMDKEAVMDKEVVKSWDWVPTISWMLGALLGAAGCSSSTAGVPLENQADASTSTDAAVAGDAAKEGIGCEDVTCQAGAECRESSAGVTCVDVDECLRDLDDCTEEQTCLNTSLGFTCFDKASPCVSDPCEAGYDCVEVNASSRQCIDQDECAVDNACPESADCISREGVTQPLCQDRAQCSTGEHNCDAESEVCVELDASPGFRCDPANAVTPDAGSPDATVLPDATTDPTYPLDGFCKDGNWAFCEDFDSIASADAASLGSVGITYRAHGAGSQQFEQDCTVSAPCEPFMKNGAFHTISDDSGFSVVMMRPRRPFDFSASGGGHLRFESDLALTGTNRKHLIVRITSEATMDVPDVRIADNAVSAEPALDIVFLGGNDNAVYGKTWKGGNIVDGFGSGYGPVFAPGQTHTVDIYMQRANVRVTVDGTEFLNDSFADLGFDVGYVHLGHLSYNPAKGGSHPTRADNILMWDNIAFDGPALPENGLVPMGQQEVVFFTEFTRKWFGSAEEKSAPVECIVRGVQADGPPVVQWEHWTVWSARVSGGAPLTQNDIDCHGSPVRGFELLAQP